MSTYQNANSPPARFGRYRTETFRVDAQDPGAQRLAEAFFRKMTWFWDIGLQSWKSRHKNRENDYFQKKYYQILLRKDRDLI